MMVVEIENFYGCYLLLCTNVKFKGRTYIGYTVDPKRRITQHNKGAKFGGAYRTSGKGPWEMVLIIHGFPSDISALRFEWAWQHPHKSRRLRQLTGKQKKETRFQYYIRIMCNMLRVGPWNRLPLTIQWLKQEYSVEFDPSLSPPTHMPVAYGPVKSIKPKKKKLQGSQSQASTSVDDEGDDLLAPLTQRSTKRCTVCVQRLKKTDETMACVHPHCAMVSHMACLAQKFLKNSDYLVPVDGKCPSCRNVVLWGDLVKKKHGCYGNLESDSQELDGEHWTEDLRV
ncbi:structure-specific endonuclease subunit slx1-like [Ptychodera flava]|uniref:structure-specific endonuclease subunit slx1-like n=1 Tax=Ptychodera flava TaxID=63121 RepID=UPI003969C90E